MAQTAMSTTAWDGKWEPLTYKLDEWLFMKDELDRKEVNDPLLKMTKQEIAEQVLHDIEGLGRNCIDDWLDEFPLFEEVQTLTPAEDTETEQKFGYQNKFEQERFSPNHGPVMPEIHKQPSVVQDLFSLSHENSATFIFSNENILYIDNEPFVNFSPLQSETTKTIEYQELKISSNENEKKNSEISNVEQPEFSWNELCTPDMKEEMAVVDEIIRNTALELDQWESDSSRSETSSDSMSTSDFSSKDKGEETDDPDWKPCQLPLKNGRKSAKKSFKCNFRCGGNQEEKKRRKKEQNKNAATRYRLKKKAEVCEILKEEESLKEKKAKLEEKVADIQSEIKYLKALMRDLFKAKGIIN